MTGGVPETCERRWCDEPVAWVLHWEERGAPGPAFACWKHGQQSETRREPVEDFVAERIADDDGRPLPGDVGPLGGVL